MNARQDKILHLLKEHGEESAQNLADFFDVSLMTIRRDLATLENEGRLTRTHGGAVLSSPGIVEFTFDRKGKKHAHEKKAIAHHVASMIQPGMSISLDSGTTTLEVAKAIAHIESLTVLTSSLAIASVLYAQENIELVLLGGLARTGSPDLTGWLTEENLKQFHVDLAIVGADGVTPDGMYTTSIEVTRVCQAIMAGAKQTILVVDHSKFAGPSFAKFASLHELEWLISDTKIPLETCEWLNAKIKHVHYVDVETLPTEIPTGS